MVWQGSAGNRCPYADQTGFAVKTPSGLVDWRCSLRPSPRKQEADRHVPLICAPFWKRVMSMSALISLTATEAHHGRGRELYGQDGG